MIDGIAAGTTSYIMTVMAYDSASTVGAGKTGITYNGGITCYYKRSNGTASVACTINTITTLGTYAGSATNAAWKEVDSTNMAGVYELQIPNNAFASGATDVAITLQLSGMVPITLYFRINPPADIQTALGTAVTCTTGGILDVNAKNINNATAVNALTVAQTATAVWTDATAGDFTTSSTVGKSVMNGVALGTGLTINGYTGNTVQTGDSYARIGALGASLTAIPQYGDFSATQKTSLNAATPASVQNISAQTGDAYARLGVAGVGLTNLGDTRIANLDTTISSRTKPADTQAAVTSVTGIAAGGINNASFNSDVQSTAYASNTLALMMYKFFDNAFTGYADGSTFTTNGFLDRFTKVAWIIRNQIAVIDVSGNTTIYKDDNVTSAFTVAAMLTDTAGTTQRLRAA